MVVLESVLSLTCDPSPFLVMMERPEGREPSRNSIGDVWLGGQSAFLLLLLVNQNATFLYSVLYIWFTYEVK